MSVRRLVLGFVNTKEESKRGSVSLAQVIWDKAEQAMRRKGFNGNFSAYVADLIRNDSEATAHHEAAPEKAAPAQPKRKAA